MIRKIIGFIPVLIPAAAVWIGMTDFMNPMAKGLHPGQVPWICWLWLAVSIASGVILCIRRLIPVGLITGAAPWLVILAQSFLPSAGDPGFLRVSGFWGLFFFVLYAVIYCTYHRTLSRP